MKTLKFEVKIKVPDGVRVKEVKDYVEESVQVWGKGQHPDCWAFDIKPNHVVVKRVMDKK